MGVPAFFRWLTVRYPQVVIDALCEEDLEYYHAEYATDKKKTGGDRNEIDLAGNHINGEVDPQVLIQKKIDENNP
jgi:5'-3' exonuclease